MDIYVIRNNQRYGPYNEQTLLQYVNDGQILKQDRAIEMGGTQENTVGFYLKLAGLKPHVQNKGNIFSQLSAIGTELIFPRTVLFSKQSISDQRFQILALVGLLPMILISIPLYGIGIFYFISLYFSIIWGLFFYHSFKTPQVKFKTTIAVFFITQISIFIVWDLFRLPYLNPFYHLPKSPFPVNLPMFVLGVGFTEELAKMIPLIVILSRAKEPQVPQTMVFYGLISGIAFGVYEGVDYQIRENAKHDYDVAFYLNILRVTALPFLHACWSGIAGYFLAFAKLYPKYRISLYFLTISIPAIIHGLYDSLVSIDGLAIFALFAVLIGLMLLVIYLKQGVNYQSKLKN